MESSVQHFELKELLKRINAMFTVVLIIFFFEAIDTPCSKHILNVALKQIENKTSWHITNPIERSRMSTS